MIDAGGLVVGRARARGGSASATQDDEPRASLHQRRGALGAIGRAR